MTDKKASTDPTFPAPPANAPLGDLTPSPEPVAAAPEPDVAVGIDPVDDVLDGLGKPPPDRLYHAPKPLPARAEHVTIPNEAVIVRDPTQPGLGGDGGLNVTPEERKRLDALMKAHAEARAEREAGEQLPPGDRDAETSPGKRSARRDPPAVETDPSLSRRPSPLPKVAMLLALLAVAAVVLFVATRHGKTTEADSATTTTTTTTSTPTVTTTTTTAATTTETPLATIPTIAVTNVESLPTSTGANHPLPTAATAHQVHTATTAATAATTAATTTAAATAPAPSSTNPDMKWIEPKIK